MATTDESRQSPEGDPSRPGKHTIDAPTIGGRAPTRTRAPGGTRSGAPRPAATTTTLLEISPRLRARDYAIAHLLHAHQVLTTTHLAAVLFDSPITCQHRLHALRQLRFIDRFARTHPGTGHRYPLCWVSGVLSARYVALARGEPPPTVRLVRERQDRIVANPTLGHLLGVNSFFVDLLTHARRDPQARLSRWWSEQETAAAYGRRIRPDGHGVWTEQSRSVGFFLEYDTGTEPLTRLVTKLGAYRRLRGDGGPAYPVLFALPTRLREQHLHRRLVEAPTPGLAVATTSPESGTDPTQGVWRLVGNGRHRLRLAELPGTHGHANPLNPGAPTPEQDPLALLQQ